MLSRTIPLLLLLQAGALADRVSVTTSGASFPLQYIDRTVPEAETHLEEADFRAGRIRRQAAEDEPVDDSAMYNPTRFEGDIGECCVDVLSPQWPWCTRNLWTPSPTRPCRTAR